MSRPFIINELSFKFAPHSSYFFLNASMEFLPGKLHFIQGKNGSGKSTLFRLLQGNVLEQEQLSIICTLDGIEHSSYNGYLSPSFIAHVKIVHQDTLSMLAPGFSVKKNIQLARLDRYPSLSGLPHALPIPAITDFFSIDYHTPVDLLSGGQRQIVAMLMALQKPTRILLLDEPTAALDPKNAQLVMQCLQDIAQKLDIFVIIIVHDQELIDRYAGGEWIQMKEQSDGIRTITKKYVH